MIFNNGPYLKFLSILKISPYNFDVDDTGIPAPPFIDDFLLLSGANFMLLNGQNFDLL